MFKTFSHDADIVFDAPTIALYSIDASIIYPTLHLRCSEIGVIFILLFIAGSLSSAHLLVERI